MRHIFLFLFLIGLNRLSFPQDPIFAFVQVDGKWGLINQDDEVVINCSYDLLYTLGIEYFPRYGKRIPMIYHPGDSLFMFTRNEKYGFLNIKNEIQVERKFFEAEKFKNGYAIIRTPFTYGLINKQGEIMFKPIKYEIVDFNENLILFKKGNKYGFMN